MNTMKHTFRSVKIFIAVCFILAILGVIISAIYAIKIYNDPSADITDWIKYWIIFRS